VQRRAVELHHLDWLLLQVDGPGHDTRWQGLIVRVEKVTPVVEPLRFVDLSRNGKPDGLAAASLDAIDAAVLKVVGTPENLVMLVPRPARPETRGRRNRDRWAA